MAALSSRKSQKCCDASGPGLLIPVTVKRRSTADTFPCVGPLPLPHKSPSSCSVRGCKHFLAHEQPAESALAFLSPSSQQLLWASVISPSRKATLSLSTTPSSTKAAHKHTHTQPAWLIISVAGKFWQTRSGKVKSEKSLSEILLSRHSGIGPLPFHVLLLKPRS